MESNQLFEAEAGLEAGDGKHSVGDQRRGNNVGVKAMVAGNGGYTKQLAASTSEESPLLPNESGDGHTPGGGDDDGTVGTKWAGENDFEGESWWNRPSVYWLLPAYMVFALAFGGIIVPKLNLVVSLICREYLAERSVNDPGFTFAPVLVSEDNPQCQIPEVQALSSKFMLYIGLISGILAAVTSPKIGALSDRYGRKPLLIATTFGYLFSEIITILTAKYPDRINYTWLLSGAVVEGICGSVVASWAMTHSYATDCTPPAKRAIAFGYLHGCLFVGIAIGPIIAAYLIEATKSILSVFYFALIIHVFFLSYITFVIPESLSWKRQLAAREKHNMEPTDDRSAWFKLKSLNITAPLEILYPTGEGSSPALRSNLLLLSAVDAILFGSAMASITVVLLYSEYEFGWHNKETNLFISLSNTCRVTALVVVLPLLNYIFRTRHKNKVRRESGVELLDRNSGSDNLDLWTIRASVAFEIVGYGGYALVRTAPLFVMSAVFASFGGMGSPTLQSALTKHVPHDRTGQLLGATGLLHALARIVWPTGISLLYAGTVDTFPQTVFFVLVGCFVAALVCSMFIKPHVYLDEPDTKPLNEETDLIDAQAAERIADEDATAI